MADKTKVAALFCKSTDEYTCKRLHDYAEQTGYIILPRLFTSEQDILDNAKENFDVILTTEQIRLPIADIEIIYVA